jgi:hypothetical protein
VKTTDTQAYPLSWPAGWPRHKGPQDSDQRFKGPTFQWDRVYRGLKEELRRIGATNIVVSTNQPLRGDGMPYAQQRNIQDVGVAAYFTRGDKSLVMAQDRFWSIIGNMRSLTMAIEGLRQMERHGGATMMERAFDGFLALPAPEDCWSILGIDREIILKMRSREHHPNECRQLIIDFFKQGAKVHMNGGDLDRLVKARDEALRQIA